MKSQFINKFKEFGTKSTFRLKGNNFMTPDILGVRKVGDYYAELSTGSGIGGGRIYGLSVSYPNKELNHDLGGCCHTVEELEEKLNALI